MKQKEQNKKDRISTKQRMQSLPAETDNAFKLCKQKKFTQQMEKFPIIEWGSMIGKHICGIFCLNVQFEFVLWKMYLRGKMSK